MHFLEWKCLNHDDVIKWKHFPRYWPFVRRIHRSPVNSPHKGQWRGALMFSLICTRINGWVNNGEAGDLKRHRVHYVVTVMIPIEISLKFVFNGPINNILAMVQIMAWRRPGDKPLSEPRMVSLPTYICIARPQWVKRYHVGKHYGCDKLTLLFTF